MVKSNCIIAFLISVLLLNTSAVLRAETQLEEVQIPLGGEQLKYVKLYAPAAERGRVQLDKEDGKVRLEWREKTERSKVCFNSGLFEGILADLRKKELHPVEFTVGIRYDGTDMPRLETYLFPVRPVKGQRNSFYFRLKQGYAEYSIRCNYLTNLDQFQIRGGAKEFTVEKLAFRVKAKKETYRKLELGAMRKTFEVLPGGSTLTDFIRHPAEAGTGKDVKLNIKLTSDALQFHSETAMPETPQSYAKKRDDAVFNDDALELFFSPQLDNRSYVQIDLNAANMVYDAEYSFDPVAADWRHRKEVNYDFRSSARHENGILRIDAELPLTMLKFAQKKIRCSHSRRHSTGSPRKDIIRGSSLEKAICCRGHTDCCISMPRRSARAN